MWWSIVVQMRGQSMEEATAHPDQLLCSYDGALYGDRQAKKMAKKVGREYIFGGGGQGQPRLVKTPLEPFGEEEFADVSRALGKGLVPPGMTLDATQRFLHEEEAEVSVLSPEAAAAAHAHGIDFESVATNAQTELASLVEDTPEGEYVIVPQEIAWRMCRIEILLAAGLDDEGLARAFASAQAADESGDLVTMEAAYAHYDRLLAGHVDENSLEPVVKELHARLFTDDRDSAGTT